MQSYYNYSVMIKTEMLIFQAKISYLDKRKTS